MQSEHRKIHHRVDLNISRQDLFRINKGPWIGFKNHFLLVSRLVPIRLLFDSENMYPLPAMGGKLNDLAQTDRGIADGLQQLRALRERIRKIQSCR